MKAWALQDKHVSLTNDNKSRQHFWNYNPVRDAFIKHHKQVWPEINQSIKNSEVYNAEIFQTGNRLFMILEVDDSFSFERKAALDNSNPKVQEWEALMWEFQEALANTPAGSKCLLLDEIYNLNISEQ